MSPWWTGRGDRFAICELPEFTVTVDGQPRRVVSAEFISESHRFLAAAARAATPMFRTTPTAAPDASSSSSIDRNNIDTHTVRQSLAPMKSFVSSLGPDDRVAVATIPPPGPMVDFTTNHALVLEALGRIVGMDDPLPGRFNISNYEALAFDNRSNPIAIQRLLYRVCGDTDPTTLSNCDRDVEQEAMTIATHLRQTTSESVSGFGALLKNLRDVEGPSRSSCCRRD